MDIPAPVQPEGNAQKTRLNLDQIRFWIRQIISSKILIIPLSVLLVFLLILVVQKVQLVAKIRTQIRLAKTAVHTRICTSLATGVPQKELSPEEKSKFREIAGGLPKCGETLRVTDAETNGVVTSDSSAIKIEASEFSATNCDRAEITLRLAKESQIVWEKKQVDSSCTVSAEGKPAGHYVISLAKSGDLPSLEGAELEVCFDLVNKSGERASQNKASDCKILVFSPYLCQKIPIPNTWR